MIIEAIRRARRSAEQYMGVDRLAEIESKHVSAVEELLGGGASGARLDLPQGLEVWREYDSIVFKTRADAVAVKIERGLAGNLREALIEEARREAALTGRDWILAVLDEQTLPERLVVRTRGRGERALVCGQRKIKKLKNLMIDHKIPSSRRADWPVVATPDGRYIWSPGLPPALEFAARDETQTLAILRASGV
jgi:tRNA(Ile)-lysidine synthase